MSSGDELTNELFHRIIDVLPRAIIVTDADGVILVWSHAAERMFGWTEAEVAGRSVLELLDPARASSSDDDALEALVNGKDHRSEQTVVHRDGREVHVFTVTRALLGPDGEPQYYVGASDDLVQLESLKRETESLTAHLRLALDAGGFGTWRWDLASGVTVWDDEMQRLFGLEPGTFDGTFEAWAALVHPDDRDHVLKALEEALETKGHYKLEHRVVLADGTMRWIEGSGRVTLDDQGNVTGTIGCSHDISERAETERELRELSDLTLESLARERVQREWLEVVAAVNDALEASTDLADLMGRVVQTVVPRLGEWCSIHVFESDRDAVPLVDVGHQDPAMVQFARDLQARYPFDPDSPTGIAAVLRTGQPELHALIDEEMIDKADVTDEQKEIVRDLGLRSAMSIPIAKRDRVFGALQFVSTHDERSYTDEDVTLAQAIAARIAATLDNRRLREARERTARTDAALARLGRRLAGAATEQQVLAVIAEDAASVLDAHDAAVGLARDAECLTFPGFDDHQLPLADGGPIADALCGPETVLREREGWASVLSLGIGGRADGAMVASPLYDDVHHPMGVLVLRWVDPRLFDEDDVNAVETLSRLCGQAIVRAQLAGHTSAMAALAAAMATARSTAEVARLLREHGTSNLGSNIANLRLVDRERATLDPVLPSSLPEEIARRYERLSLRRSVPLTDAVREDAPVWLSGIEEYRERYPDGAVEAEAAGVSATAAIPLRSSNGTVEAAVAFAWPSAMRFDERFRSRVTTLCDLASQTLERVRLFEAEHAVVASMQQRLLTPLPVVAGLELASYYQPAASPVGMGGDWYEATVLDDGSLVAIIGDVVGHGVEAVAAMAQIQHLLTGLIRAGTPPGDLLATTNAMIAGPDPTYATALLVHLDPANGRIGYTSAGHPPALLRLPDGSIEQLEQNQSPMIGLNIAARDLVYVACPPGTLVLAYTDGLIERRGETIDAGVDRLADHFARLDATELHPGLGRLVDAVRSADPEQRATVDDVAAILIRVR